MKYIDAEKLITEIERRIEETKSMKPSFDQFWAGQISAFKGARTIIDTLQQEQLEVDLEKEIDRLFEIVRGEDGMAHISSLNGSICDDWKKSPYAINKPGFIHFARHFYELGLNARRRTRNESTR